MRALSLSPKPRFVASVACGLACAAGAAHAAPPTSPTDRQRLDTGGRAYACVPAPTASRTAKPPQPPELPAEVEARVKQNRAALAADPDCPAGTVVEPKKLDKVKGGPVSRRALEGRQSEPLRAEADYQYGAWYSYAIGTQWLPWQQQTYALFASQTNEKPFVQWNTPDHSISQLWGVDYSPNGRYSTQELGWTVDQGFGDREPHLFIFHFDDGVPMGYADGSGGGGWVPYTNVIGPGSVVTHNDTYHTYGIQRSGSNWWFYYDGYWLGYIPRSAYPRYFNWGFSRIDAGGEVAANTPYTCTDMGAYPAVSGTDPYSSAWYPWISRARGDTGAGELASMSAYMSDPGQYQMSQFTGSSFRYGGGGWC